jgi:hypothetical protein
MATIISQKKKKKKKTIYTRGFFSFYITLRYMFGYLFGLSTPPHSGPTKFGRSGGLVSVSSGT